MSKNEYPLLSRLGARIIDALLFGLLSALLTSFCDFDYIWSVIFLFLYPIYFIIMHIKYKKTIGKIIFGLKLKSFNSKSLSPIKITIREILVFFILYFDKIIEEISFMTYIQWGGFIQKLNIISAILVLLIMLTNKYHRSIHDFITGTKVIKESEGISRYIEF